MQNPLTLHALLGFLLLMSTSCGTIAARKFDPYDHWGQGYVAQNIYGGVRLDWHTPHLLALFDLPLSFIADTFLLPLTIYEEYFPDDSLHHAAISGDLNTVKAALDAGKFIDTINEYGHTLLMSATVGLHSAMVEELLKRGANVNALSKNTQCTALLYAILQVQTQRSIAGLEKKQMSEEQRAEAKKIFSLLMNAGGKIYFKDGLGWSELDRRTALSLGVGELVN